MTASLAVTAAEHPLFLRPSFVALVVKETAVAEVPGSFCAAILRDSQREKITYYKGERGG